MIHLITTSHPSKRFPGKNDLLARYTLDWAAIAAQYCAEPVKFLHAGPYRPLWLPLTWQHVETALDDDHLAAVSRAEKAARPAADEVLVLAQLTQPLRSRHLLAAAVDLCRSEKLSVISAVQQRNTCWRRVHDEGTWGPKTHTRQTLHDGRIYAWQPGDLPDIFDPYTAHAVLITGEPWCLVDVDNKSDLPPGLESLWAHALDEPLIPNN